MALFLQLTIVSWLLVGCSGETLRQWQFEEVATNRLAFNGGKLSLPPDSDFSNLELELVRSASGTRFYLNLFTLRAPPLREEPNRTTVVIEFEQQEPWVVHPYLMEGGQKLLLPGEVSDYLIEALLEGIPFKIQIGRSSIQAISEGFQEGYQSLLDLPLECGLK